jgi:rhamnogalacturonyl hydrolase YesR
MKIKLFFLIQFSTLMSFSLVGQQMFTKQDVITKMKLVNDYWILQNPNPGNNQWARSAYFTGDMDFYKLYPKESYMQYAELWAENNSWTLNGGIYTRVADNQICGQTYIDLYNLDSIKQPAKIENIRASVDSMIHTPKSDDWWWVDALYMAMPVFAKIGVVSNNDSVYFNKMYQLYTNTKITRGLFNSNEALWYRDESFKPPYQTSGGKNSFWARGNGWVLAAHVKVLQLLPQNDKHRAEYIDTFQKMAAALKSRQRADGFWNVSLDDSTDYGGIETSGTSFFTYGIAWGINNALLDSATYYPVVAKAWNALSSVAVQPNGFLGYVQGVGSGPSSSQPVTVSSTADFGVGAFLLAGTEVIKLAKGPMPIPSNFTVQAIKVQDNTHIQVSFNKKINPLSALLPANYLINNSTFASKITC